MKFGRLRTICAAGLALFLFGLPGLPQTPGTKVSYPNQVKNGPLFSDAIASTIPEACAPVNAAHGTLSVTKRWPVTTQTIACQLSFNGGMLIPAANQTITLAVPVAPANQQIFDTSASGSKVVLTGPGDLQPVWWGADATGVNDSAAAIQAMFVAGTTSAMRFASQQGTARYLINSTVTLNVPVAVSGPNNPGPILDFGTANFQCAQTSGPCIHILDSNANGYQGIVIRNGTLAYIGSSSNVTGMLIEDYTRPTVDSTKFINFNTSGSIGLVLKNVEEAFLGNLLLSTNTLGLQLTEDSTANRIQTCTFQSNAMAIQVLQGSYGNTFDSNVIQSTTGAHAVEVKNVTGDPDSITETRFVHNHFENNGDGTTGGRDLYFYADSGRVILTTILNHNVWNQSTTTTSRVEFDGAGSKAYVSATGNQCNGGATPLFSGVVSLIGGGENNCQMGEFDTNSNSEGFPGMIFWGPGAAKKYNIVGGRPGYFDSNLVFDDITGGMQTHLGLVNTGGWFLLSPFPLNGSQAIGSATTRWPKGWFTDFDVSGVANFVNAPIAPFYRISNSGSSQTWAGLQAALTAAGVACTLGGNQGMMSYVIDGNASGYGNPVTGGGGVNSVFIVCNGSDWIIH